MRLLDAEIIKEQEDKSVEEKRLRVAKLREEENNTVKRINKLLKEEEEIKKRLIDKREEDQASLQVRKTVLFLEVNALEERKRDALKPIGDLKVEFEKSLKENIANNDILKKKISEFAAKEDGLKDRMEIWNDRDQLLDERDEDLNRRELRTKKAEEEIDRQAKELGKKWVQYHEAVSALNTAQSLKAKEVEALAASNANFKKSLDEEKARLVQEDLAIKDKYVALQRAKEHLGIK